MTEGNIVRSSAALVEPELPAVAIETLLRLVEAEGIGFDRLRAALAGLGGVRVHVVGDTVVDSVTRTTMTGAWKTPSPSLRYERRDDTIGGAAIVAEHLKRAGADVVLSTVLGDDPLKDFVLAGLGRRGIACDPVIERARPTAHKNAVVCGGVRLIKLDTREIRAISRHAFDSLAAQLRATRARAVVFSDFGHGVFDSRTFPALIEASPRGSVRAVHAQASSSFGDFDILTPAGRGLRFSLAGQDTAVRRPAARPRRRAAVEPADLKLVVSDNGLGASAHESFAVESLAKRVVDTAGAGDALLAYATLAMVTDGSLRVAAILGALAAALACELDGNVPVGPEDVAARIDQIERRAR